MPCEFAMLLVTKAITNPQPTPVVTNQDYTRWVGTTSASLGSQVIMATCATCLMTLPLAEVSGPLAQATAW